MEDLIKILRSKNERVPRPLPTVTAEDIARAEDILKQPLPPDYVELQLGAGDVVFGTIEPVTLQLGSGHTYLAEVLVGARAIGVPNNVIPICEDNGDYYCLTADGKVQYWSHNGFSAEEWPSLYFWVRDVWLASGAL